MSITNELCPIINGTESIEKIEIKVRQLKFLVNRHVLCEHSDLFRFKINAGIKKFRLNLHDCIEEHYVGKLLRIAHGLPIDIDPENLFKLVILAKKLKFRHLYKIFDSEMHRNYKPHCSHEGGRFVRTAKESIDTLEKYLHILYCSDHRNIYRLIINNIHCYWTECKQIILPNSRYNHSITVINKNLIYICGGLIEYADSKYKDCLNNSSGLTPTCIVLSSSGQWMEGPNMIHARSNHTAMYIHSRNGIYVIGGRSLNNKMLTCMEYFDFKQWWPRSSFMGNIQNPLSTLWNQKLYVLAPLVKNICCYNFDKDQWFSIESHCIDCLQLPIAIFGHEDRMYVFQRGTQYLELMFSSDLLHWTTVRSYPINQNNLRHFRCKQLRDQNDQSMGLVLLLISIYSEYHENRIQTFLLDLNSGGALIDLKADLHYSKDSCYIL
ncbi:hypothetical protein GJ496_008358 [Pomphorhynchus laevis]|nr:hypothetical protein GJ496_008358 [Pomphorhynchus laevis]